MPSFQKRFESFERLVVDLNVEWQMFEDLFADPTNWATFTDSASMFFHHLERALLDLLFVSVSRFFDPEGNGQYRNLSLEMLASSREVSPWKDNLIERIERMRPIWKRGISVWRNKRLAHNDVLTVTRHVSLPHVHAADLKALVSGISEFAGHINHVLYRREASYVIDLSDWVPAFLNVLRLGLQRSRASEGSGSA